MTKVLTTAEIADLFNSHVFSQQEERRLAVGKAKGYHTYGRITTANGDRPASTTVRKEDGMISVRLGVPGGGNLTFSFSLFEEDATPERVGRYIAHHLKQQAKRVKEWEAELASWDK